MNITEESRVKQIGNVDITDLDGEKVMMDLDKGRYLVMNEVGTRIWDIAEETKSIREITNILLDEYEVDEETCREQVIVFVRELIDSHLLELQ